MKINNFKVFLKENISDDEYSYLNDDLDGNKLDKDPYYDSTYDPYNDPYSSYSEDDGYEDDDYEDDDDIKSDDLQHLHYLLRQMFRNSGINNVDIGGTANQISINVQLSHRDRLRNIVKIIEVVNKIKKDILPQYDSDVEMWRTKHYIPLLMFTFYYNEGLEDDIVPF
jgi:hypothetical protein